jgi:hypothetical protein
MSKIFERVVLARLNITIEERNLIPGIQFGFRKAHNTVEQIHRLVNQINTALEEKKFCPAVFLDVSKAFDRVYGMTV